MQNPTPVSRNLRFVKISRCRGLAPAADTPPPTPLLLKLPSELLIEIANHLDSLTDIKSLTYTSLRLARELTQPVLYKYAAYDEHCIWALIWAAANGSEDMVRYVLENGYRLIIFAESWVNGERPRRPIYVSPGKPSKAVIRFVLAQGVNLVFGYCRVLRDHSMSTPMHAVHWVMLYWSKRFVKLLLEKGADIEAKGYWDNSTPLVVASRRGMYESVQVLLEKGADIHHKCKDGKTALHAAIDVNNYKVIQILLENGARVAVRDHDLCSPLDYCYRQFRYVSKLSQMDDIIILLSRYDFFNEDRHRRTILHHAAMKNAKDLVKQLLIARADVSRKDAEGQTVLHFAAKNGNGIISRMLLEYGADVAAADNLGRTPLHLAAQHGPGAVETLLEYGAPVNVQDKFGRTPLHIAAKYSTNAAEPILQESVNVNIQDKLGRTPLHLAAGRSWKLTRLLLEKGAIWKLKDKFGRTPRDIGVKWSSKMEGIFVNHIVSSIFP